MKKNTRSLPFFVGESNFHPPAPYSRIHYVRRPVYSGLIWPSDIFSTRALFSHSFSHFIIVHAYNPFVSCAGDNASCCTEKRELSSPSFFSLQLYFLLFSPRYLVVITRIYKDNASERARQKNDTRS